MGTCTVDAWTYSLSWCLSKTDTFCTGTSCKAVLYSCADSNCDIGTGTWNTDSNTETCHTTTTCGSDVCNAATWSYYLTYCTYKTTVDCVGTSPSTCKAIAYTCTMSTGNCSYNSNTSWNNTDTETCKTTTTCGSTVCTGTYWTINRTYCPTLTTVECSVSISCTCKAKSYTCPSGSECTANGTTSWV